MSKLVTVPAHCMGKSLMAREAAKAAHRAGKRVVFCHLNYVELWTNSKPMQDGEPLKIIKPRQIKGRKASMVWLDSDR